MNNAKTLTHVVTEKGSALNGLFTKQTNNLFHEMKLRMYFKMSFGNNNVLHEGNLTIHVTYRMHFMIIYLLHAVGSTMSCNSHCK